MKTPESELMEVLGYNPHRNDYVYKYDNDAEKILCTPFMKEKQKKDDEEHIVGWYLVSWNVQIKFKIKFFT